MKFRAVASLALAAAVAAGLSGCNLFSPQRTTLRYDASDGVSLNLGGVDLRNALLITDNTSPNDVSHRASLVVAIVNTTGEAGELRLEAKMPPAQDGTQANGHGATAKVSYGADSGLQAIGYGGGQIVWLEGIDFHPGGAVNLTAIAPDGSTETVLVPVLDVHGLAEYSTLLPSETPVSHHSTATPTSTGEPAATEESSGENAGE